MSGDAPGIYPVLDTPPPPVPNWRRVQIFRDVANGMQLALQAEFEQGRYIPDPMPVREHRVSQNAMVAVRAMQHAATAFRQDYAHAPDELAVVERAINAARMRMIRVEDKRRPNSQRKLKYD